jgi:hypothetical protein
LDPLEAANLSPGQSMQPQVRPADQSVDGLWVAALEPSQDGLDVYGSLAGHR